LETLLLIYGLLCSDYSIFKFRISKCAIAYAARLSAIVSILILRVRVRDYGALSKVNHNELAYYFFLLEMF